MEYKSVQKRTREPGLMRAAHETEISAAFAHTLIERILGATATIRTCRGRRAYAKFVTGRGVVIKFPEGRPLNVETVLHECAHAIAGASAGHGPVFAQALDVLLRAHLDECERHVAGHGPVIMRSVEY
jgi:hypothetical protein